MIQTFQSFLSAIIYHAWRAMTCRPQFIHLADTRTTWLTFFLAFGATNLLRISIFDHSFSGFWMELFEWSLGVVILTALFSRSDRSNVLIACIFAAMVGFDLLEIVSRLVFDFLSQDMTMIAIDSTSLDSVKSVPVDLISYGDGYALTRIPGKEFDSSILGNIIGVFRMIAIPVIAGKFSKLPTHIQTSGYCPK